MNPVHSPNLTPKQLDILCRINQSRKTLGYSPTMQELADVLGVSKVTVFEHVEALIKKGTLLRQPNKARSLEVNPDFEMPEEASPTRLPLVGTISAGYPIGAFEDRQFIDLQDLFPTGRKGSTFVLEVRGDSMIDEQIRSGDMVVVQKTDTAHQGQTVVALLDDGEATLKKFYRENGRIRLQPANDKYEPIIVDQCQIQGVVMGVIRSY